MALKQSTDFENLIKQDVITVVDFYADWCGPCRQFAPVFEEVAGEMEQNNFIKLDVDAHPEIASQYQVRSIPTILFFKAGKVVEQYVGVLSKQDFLDKIAKLG